MGVKFRGTFKNFTGLNVSATPAGLGLTFDANEGESILSLPRPFRENHKFVEWNTQPDGSGDTVLANDIETFGSQTVYAIWLGIEQAVTWSSVTSGFGSTNIWSVATDGDGGLDCCW